MKGQLGTTLGTVVLDWVSVRLVMSVGSIDIDPTTHIGLFLIVARGGRLRVQSGTVKYTRRYRLHLN